MSAPANDATTALWRAIRQRLRASAVTLVTFRSRSWASVTFSGARHEIKFRIAGDDAQAAADRFLADLECAEFQLRGHLLADIVLVSRETVPDGVEIGLEALTVEEG